MNMRIAMTGMLALAVSASGALAQSDGGSSEGSGGGSDGPASAQVMETAKDQLIPGAAVSGGTLYAGGQEDDGWTATTVYEDVGDGWSEVGTIADLVISQDSAYAGILGELEGRRVFLSIQDIALVLLDEGKVAYVTKLSEEELADLPEAGPDLSP